MKNFGDEPQHQEQLRSLLKMCQLYQWRLIKSCSKQEWKETGGMHGVFLFNEIAEISKFAFLKSYCFDQVDEILFSKHKTPGWF